MCSDEKWLKVKTEYVTSKISLRSLSEKYDIPFPTIRDRANREEWTAERKKARGFLGEKIVQKVIQNTSQKIADTLQKELEATELINDLVLRALRDPQQFNRHLVQVKEKSFEIVDYRTSSGKDGQKVMNTESQDVEERIFEKLDTKALKDLAEALNKSTELKKKILGIVDTDVREKLELDKERLQLEKVKAGQDDDDEERQTGIVLIPTVDQEAYEKEAEAERLRYQAEYDAKKAQEGSK